MDDFNKTPNIYPNLNAIPLNSNRSNEQQISVAYDAIAVDDSLDIHNYLMKKNDIV